FFRYCLGAAGSIGSVWQKRLADAGHKTKKGREPMARMPRQVSSTGLHHVILKGLNGMPLFEEPADYERFLALLAAALSRTGVLLLSWCLMTNHVHLAVLDQNHSLSKMVHYVAFQYASFFNRKHGRSGPLYNGRFWSSAITDEGHLLQVVKYIHLNPQRANLASAREYAWSSYKEYVGEASITDTSIVLGSLASPEHFESFIASSEGLSPVRARGERMSDWQAREVLEECGLCFDAGEVLAQQSNEQRALAVIQARHHDIGTRQLQRITGLSRRVIQQASQRKTRGSCSGSRHPREAPAKRSASAVPAAGLVATQPAHASDSPRRRLEGSRILRKQGARRLRH
ncbi:MAG: transposase, partial [Coriobacteriales bacterium]